MSRVGTRLQAGSLLASCAVPEAFIIGGVVRDLEASLRFYRDGLGLDLLQDRQVEGDWPDLSTRRAAACARSSPATREFRRPRRVLEAQRVPTVTSRRGRRLAARTGGFFLLSFFVDVKPH